MSKPVCAVIGIGPKNGASFARRFSREGYAVALLSRSTTLSSKLANELSDAKAYACDVTDPLAMASAFESVRNDLGDVDVLIYNAGSGSWGNIEELEPEAFERSWRINAMGGFLAAKQVIGPMKAKGRGSIVFVGATASLRGKPFTTAFAPAKAAQRSLAQAMARHLWPSGVHVSLLIIDGMIDKATGDEITTIDPDQIADTAVYLTNQDPSAWSFEVDVRPLREKW